MEGMEEGKRREVEQRGSGWQEGRGRGMGKEEARKARKRGEQNYQKIGDGGNVLKGEEEKRC